MKSNNAIRHSLYVCGAALCTIMLSSVADADPPWQEWRGNFYGYGGDYTEVTSDDIIVTADGPVSADVMGGTYSNYFPVAVNKTYTLRNNAGTVTITSVDVVQDSLTFASQSQPFFYTYTQAHISTFWAFHNDPQFGKKGRHIIMQSRSSQLCPNETYNSSIASANGIASDGSYGFASAVVDLAYCPEGGFPIQAQAQYWHGIQ